MMNRDPQAKALRRQNRSSKIVSAVETAQSHQQPNRARLKLSQSKHTGRILPIHSTSYAVLFFLLLFTGVFLFVIGQQSAVAGPPQIGSGSIGLGGTVTAVPPTSSATITSPADGSRFDQSVITVSGVCYPELLVEIYRNDAFAGSQICDSNGSFSLQITIIPGTNVLIAKISNSSGQYGPDSIPVTVYLDAATVSKATDGSSSPTATTALPFLIYTQPVQRGIFPKQAMMLAYGVDGGTAPYAVSMDWGDDSQSDIVALNSDGDFKQSHTYDEPGQFVVSINGTDSQQKKAFIQSIAIVNGTVPAGATTIAGSFVCEQEQTLICTIVHSANMLWPVFLITATMTISFWLGEQLVLHKYKKIVKSV